MFLTSSVFYLFLPASIFSESSDLTHNERDPLVKAVSSGPSGFSITTEELVKTVNFYQNSLKNVVTSNNLFTYTSQSEDAVGFITEEEFNLICAIVESEGGTGYDGALAVITTVVNRIIQGGYEGSWEREKSLKSQDAADPLKILTASGQFEGYINYSYLKHLNKVSEEVEQAVFDCLGSGKRSHNYLSFRGYPVEGGVEIEGNYYFEEITAEEREIHFNIGAELNELKNSSGEVDIEKAFENPDPSGLGTWDLLYLICAYDVSKNNLEGDNNPVPRYSDLVYNTMEYILKAIYGVSVEETKEETIPLTYPVYEEREVTYFDGEIKTENFYVKTGEESTIVPVTRNMYEKVADVSELSDPIDLEDYTLTEAAPDKLIFSNGSGETKELPLTSTEVFRKTEQEETLTPEVTEVTETHRVYGLSKAVLLSVLGLEPGEPYKVLKGLGTTNSDMIEYSRQALIKTLNLSVETSGGQIPPTGSSSGWIWPLDPNGRGAFIITSLMGTRESPGGIGSTDHGGTDIGAAYGVAILAVKDGTVEVAAPYGGYGNCVRLNHGVLDDGASYKTLYGHMSSIAVHPGESVKQGQIIGYVGSTGWSTGPHLHFEVIKNDEKINGLSLYGEDIYSRLTYYL